MEGVSNMFMHDYGGRWRGVDLVMIWANKFWQSEIVFKLSPVVLLIKLIICFLSQVCHYFILMWVTVKTTWCFRWGTHLYMSLFLSICLLYIISQEPSSSNHNFWYTRVKWWYFQVFYFHFLDILFFWAIRGVKGQK